MKRILTILALTFATTLAHSQAPTPAPAAAPAPSPVLQLQAIRDANVKLLEQQAKTLELLEKLSKDAQQLKILGKRA